MKNTPIDYQIVKEKIDASNIPVVGKAKIREIVRLVNEIEKESGEKFIRMEMGVPSLQPPQIALEAEMEALRNGVASKYPMIDGIPELKTEISKFVKNFVGVDVAEQGCIPTVGSMQGGFAVFMLAGKIDPRKDTTLFIDPGFPVQKQQLNVLGQKYEAFDVYNYRGEKLKEKLESFLSKGNINSIIYSNPNNPSWICFTEEELKIIGDLANKYDVIVVEDLAYFGMDFRIDISAPGVAPFQPTVANYTDNFILLISSSKSFSYAGQRIGMMVIGNELYKKRYPGLMTNFKTEEFGYAMIYGAVYSLSSGTCHSAQYGLAAILKAVNEGAYNFREDVVTYGERATIMKKLFTENGFNIVYDKDIDKDLADGFYFTIAYPGMEGEQLLEEFLYYGISAISLVTTGSERTEGLRACVSQVTPDQFDTLESRLKAFNENHKN